MAGRVRTSAASADPVGRAVAAFVAGASSPPRLCLAFSGGLDSTVLAHALMRVRRRLGGLRFVHVDHDLQAGSAEWARHCARIARAWRVPLVSLRAHVKVGRGDSLEAVAREARYGLLRDALTPGEWLVTAQHRDDQVETLLLMLFRGAGVAGLAAMPRSARFGAGRIVRPLLDCARADLEAYARRHRLQWVEDPSNASERFSRNYLRHRVMPLLRDRWGGIDDAIARAAAHLAEAGGLLADVARADLAAAMDGAGLNVAVLRRLAPARLRNLLRAFITRAGVTTPSTAQMAAIVDGLLAARGDAQPEVRWHGAVMRRRGGRLELQVISEDPPSPSAESHPKSWDWKRNRRFDAGAAGVLELRDDAAGPIDPDRLPERLVLRPRRGGESLRPGARARTRPLKKLLQDARLSVEERARLPLLFAGTSPRDRLLIAGDRWIDASIAANVKSRRRVRLVWRRSVPFS